MVAGNTKIIDDQVIIGAAPDRNLTGAEGVRVYFFSFFVNKLVHVVILPAASPAINASHPMPLFFFFGIERRRYFLSFRFFRDRGSSFAEPNFPFQIL